MELSSRLPSAARWRWELASGEEVSLMRFAGAEPSCSHHLDTAGVEVFFTAGSALPDGSRRSGWPRCGSPKACRTPYTTLRPLIARLPAPRQDIGRIAVEVEARSMDGKSAGLSDRTGCVLFTSMARTRHGPGRRNGIRPGGPLTPAQAFRRSTFSMVWLAPALLIVSAARRFAGA